MSRPFAEPLTQEGDHGTEQQGDFKHARQYSRMSVMEQLTHRWSHVEVVLGIEAELLGQPRWLTRFTRAAIGALFVRA